jgi:hypothetical protein
VSVLLNLLFGLIPTLTLAWSIAADERKTLDERVVASEGDRRQQKTIFAMIYGLWLLTLAMWNWMRGESPVWIALWSLLGVTALAFAAISRRRR